MTGTTKIAYWKKARDVHTCDEIEIDEYDSRKVSASEDGAWVAAWVWISVGEITG